MTAAADMMAAVPEPDAPEVGKVDVGIAPKRSRSGTSGAERARRAKAGTAPKRAPAPPKAPALTERLTNTLVMVGMGWSMVHQADGLVFMDGAPGLADALVKLGEQKPRVRKSLEALCSASAYAELTAALLPIAVGIGMNHGMVPPHVMAALGMPAPEQQPAPLAVVPEPAPDPAGFVPL